MHAQRCSSGAVNAKKRTCTSGVSSWLNSATRTTESDKAGPVPSVPLPTSSSRALWWAISSYCLCDPPFTNWMLMEAAADGAVGARYCTLPLPATDPAKQPHLAGGEVSEATASKPRIDEASIHACVWRLATERRAPDALAASREAAFLRAQNGIMLQEIARLRLQNVNPPSTQSGSCSTLHNNAAG